MASKMYEIAFQLGAKISSSFGATFNTASSKIKALESQSKAANKSFLGLSEGGSKIFKAASGIVGGIGFAAAAKKSVELASNLVEVQNVVDTTFGGGSKQIDAWSKTALNGFGLSELQAKQFNGTLGALMKSSGITGSSLVGMSENLTGLSGDFASFYNLPIEDAFEKLKSGISGETEPLKSLGINMSVANLQAYALTKGISKPFDKMSQGEQTMLRYNYLMNVSKDVQGDFNKTSNTFANQLRIAQTNLAQTGATIGSKVLPMLNKLLLAFNNGGMGNLGKILNSTFKTIGTAISFAKQHAELFKAVLLGLGSAVATFKLAGLIKDIKSFSTIINLVKSMQKISSTFQLVRMGAVGFGSALKFLIGPVGIAAVAIGVLVTVVYLVYKNWAPISKFFSKVWADVKGVFNNFWNWLKNFLSTWGPGILAVTLPFIGIPLLIVQHWSQIKPKLSAVWNSLKASVSSTWTSIKNTISNVATAISTTVAKVWKVIITAITSSPLFKIVSAVFKGILAVVIVVAYNIYTAVSGVLKRIWSVITSIWNSIYSTVASVVTKVRNIIVSVWNTIYSAVAAILTRVWSFIVRIWNSIYASVSSVLNTIWNVIVRIWTTIYSSVSSILTSIWTFIVTIWNNVYSSVSSIVTTIWNTIVNGFNSAASGVTSIFQSMYNTVVNIFQGIWSAIKSIINTGIGMINGFIGGVNSVIGVANNVPGVHIGTVGTIPQLANGGYIKHRPGGILANIGEGKEDEIVSPVSKLKSIIGSNNTSNIQQPTFVYSPQVTIMGNVSKDDINEALSMSQSEFNRMAENFFKNKQRLSFD